MGNEAFDSVPALEAIIKHLKHGQKMALIVGFSYALESYCRETGCDLIDAARALRHEQKKLTGDQPPGVRDRFAFFCQTVGLLRLETEMLRQEVFDPGS